MAESQFRKALRILTSHQIDFIIVGGVAAVLRGAVYTTRDLDVVHSRDPENVKRILGALQELDARYYYRPDLRPKESHLASPGQQLLATNVCRIDFLGQIGSGRDYAGLLSQIGRA